MSKLTDLEKIPLTELCKNIKALKKVYSDNEDCFQDTVHKQYQVSTEEQITFDNFMTVVHKLNDVLDSLHDNASLIENHFLE